MELTPCSGKYKDFFNGKFNGIILKENWQSSMLLQLNFLMNEETNKLMTDEKTS